MTAHMFTDLTGTDGLFTFNFFCESLVSSLHTLSHILEDAGTAVPEKARDIPDMLAEMGSNLLQDYSENKLDLDRFKRELLEFYDLAFAANDEFAPIVLQGDQTLQYYYYVYMQGVNLFFPNMLQGILRDLPSGADAQPFMEEISRDFANLSASPAD